MKKKVADFSGYEWGYIKNNGSREDSGTATTIKENEIAGVWGRYFRKGIQRPCYRETFKDELPDKDCVSVKTALQTLNLQQCMTFAYPESRPVSSEVMNFNAEEAVKTKLLQMWKCQCGHTFYSEIGKRTVKQFFKGMFQKVKCAACGEYTAVRAGKVRKPA